MTKKIKVYLCARISKDAHKWNELVCSYLKKPISVFMPQNNNPWNLKHESFPMEVFNTDLAAIKESDMCLVLPPYGRDCAWEIGWYSNSSKLIVVFVDKDISWLRDWMVKGGIDYILTTNSNTWQILSKDPMLGHKKAIFINSLDQLSETIIKLIEKGKNGKR